MTKKNASRGFSQLKGKTIEKVKVAALNSVILTCSDGTVFEIESDVTDDLRVATANLNVVPPKEKKKKVKPVEEEFLLGSIGGHTDDKAWPWPTK